MRADRDVGAVMAGACDARRPAAASWTAAGRRLGSAEPGGWYALRGCGEQAAGTAGARRRPTGWSSRASRRARAAAASWPGGAPAEFGESAWERGRVPRAVPRRRRLEPEEVARTSAGSTATRCGRRGDALRILRRAGMEWVRLRVWVDPADGYHDRAELLPMARRARAAGQRVLVDLHYSDFWADPGKQWTPAAWEGQSPDELRSARSPPTRAASCASLVAQGTPPDMVQLGNEINPGMLWDYAATWTGCSSADDGAGGTREVCHTENWDGLARLLKAGYAAVKSRVAADAGDAAPRRGRRQRDVPLVVRQRHRPRRAVRRHRRVVLRLLARDAGGAAGQPARRHGPLRQGRRGGRDRLPVHARRRGRLGEHHRHRVRC